MITLFYLLLIVSMIAFAAPLVYLFVNGKTPESIPNSHELFVNSLGKNIHTFLLFVSALFTLPAWLEASPDGITFLCFLGSIFLFISSMVMAIENTSTWRRRIAESLTFLFALAAYIWCFSTIWYVALICMLIIIPISVWKKCWMLGVQSAAFISVIITSLALL